MNKLQEIVWAASRNARKKRAATFRRNFQISETTKILDIGSENGENINLVLSGTKFLPENVFIADIDGEAIKSGHEKFGFEPVLLDESGALPFADKRFDIVYCSSVIEHVTVAKGKVWEMISGADFRAEAWEKQNSFAKEIARVGRAYFVQTPSRAFPIESHTWLPFFSYLPRPSLVKAMRVSNRYWIKQAIPDFNLLTGREMAKLFPEAEIISEKKFGLVKSIMAIKTLR